MTKVHLHLVKDSKHMKQEEEEEVEEVGAILFFTTTENQDTSRVIVRIQCTLLFSIFINLIML